MSKNQIKVGSSVVFAQRYMPDEPYANMYGKTGRVASIEDGIATVSFYSMVDPVEVPLSDLDLDYDEIAEEDSQSSLAGLEALGLVEDHELSGSNRAQLIAYKLLAQENDSELNNDINHLLELHQ